MTDRAYYIVDAFTSEPWSGNPAAVVLESDALFDEQMMRIAAEFHLSETAFVLPPARGSSGAIRLRWFTPRVEVSMCGHATVAAVHALVRSGRWRDFGLADPASGSVAWTVETLGGVLTAFIEALPGRTDEYMFWLDLVDPVLSEAPTSLSGLCAALGLAESDVAGEPAPACSQDRDLILFVRDVAALNACRPDFAALDGWCRSFDVRGISLATTATLTPAVHVQSRFFAPPAGINEDPVTGSVHGPLAAILARHGIGAVGAEVTALTCVQGIPDRRSGLIHVLVQRQGARFAVRIGGRAVTTMTGTILA